MKKKLMAMMMCLTLTVGTFAGCAGGETKEAEDSKTCLLYTSKRSEWWED